MGCDKRIPRNAVGYIDGLTSQTITKSYESDCLKQLSRYVPDLVKEYQESEVK